MSGAKPSDLKLASEASLTAIADRPNAIPMDYLKRDDACRKRQAHAVEPRTGTPNEMHDFPASGIVRWANAVRDAGIKPQ